VINRNYSLKSNPKLNLKNLLKRLKKELNTIELKEIILKFNPITREKFFKGRVN